MSNDDQTQPVRPGDPSLSPSPEGAAGTPLPPAPVPAPEAGSAAGTASTPVARRGFRERLGGLRGTGRGDRTFGLAALIASALAGIIVGGLGGAAMQSVSHDGDGDRDGMMQRRDSDGDEGFGGPGGFRGGPPGLPGQLPPSPAPEDDSTS